MRLIRFTTLTLAACAGGCLYSAMGVEHNAAAVSRLRAGMQESECIAALARGGRVTIEQVLAIGSSEERQDALYDDEVLASLAHAEAESGVRAERAVVVHRLWGTMGFGIVHLFLDARGLVGYHLDHYN